MNSPRGNQLPGNFQFVSIAIYFYPRFNGQYTSFRHHDIAHKGEGRVGQRPNGVAHFAADLRDARGLESQGDELVVGVVGFEGHTLFEHPGPSGGEGDAQCAGGTFSHIQVRIQRIHREDVVGELKVPDDGCTVSNTGQGEALGVGLTNGRCFKQQRVGTPFEADLNAVAGHHDLSRSENGSNHLQGVGKCPNQFRGEGDAQVCEAHRVEFNRHAFRQLEWGIESAKVNRLGDTHRVLQLEVEDRCGVHSRGGEGVALLGQKDDAGACLAPADRGQQEGGEEGKKLLHVVMVLVCISQLHEVP